MAFDMNKFVERFNAAVGKDSQEEIAAKLHMTQGNVSKIITGKQMPKLDTVYLISEEYKVSVDWLLGLSEEKRIVQVSNEQLSYTAAVDTVMVLERHGSKVEEKSGSEILVSIKDPLFFALLKKSRALYAADRELYSSWKGDKLSQFADKPLLWQFSWNEEGFDYLACEASTEAHWLKLYEDVKAYEDEMAEIMRPEPGPFDD